MRDGINVEVSAADRARLEAVAADRDSPQKHVWRARIVLATADGLGTGEVVRRTGKSKPCVRRWQERFMREGVAGLLRDRTRPPRVPPLSQATIDRVVALTPTEPPGEATHWTAPSCRTMATSPRPARGAARCLAIASRRARSLSAASPTPPGRSRSRASPSLEQDRLGTVPKSTPAPSCRR